jgi:GNAT superfamily N-acetyltransferase
MTRVANLQDSEQLALLCGQLGYPATPAQVRRRLEALQRAGDQAVYVSLSAGGNVSGWIHVFVRHLLLVDRHAEIGGLVVLAGQRGRGIGRLLVKRAEDWARERGCQSVYVHSNVARQRAPRFYEGIGYRQIKTSRLFLKELH